MTSGRDTVVVREATPDDIPALAEMRRAWTAEHQGRDVEADDDFLGDFAAWYAREAHQRVTWIVQVAGVPVGMLNMLVFTRMPRPEMGGRASRWGYVANVYVQPAHRDGGVGSSLLAAATTYADDAGFARLVLSPTERSMPFYARAGFRPATELLVRPGRDVG